MLGESTTGYTSVTDDPIRYLPLPSPGISPQFPPTVPVTPEPPLTPTRVSYSPSEGSSKQAFLAPFQAKQPSIGIIDTPQRGRRLTLFQETSEESFEESLMAGGYGRYRTAEWVRQPQPLVLSQSGAPVIALLDEQQQQLPVEEQPPPPPPTEKELLKRKRLAAFLHSGISSNNSRLFPVELEGKGRVLLDVPQDPTLPESSSSPNKRGRGTNNASNSRRGRRKAETPPKESEDVALPNWPDAEFPWRLRKEERFDQVKAEETERLRIIENFFDRDTDEEDEGEPLVHAAEEDEDVIPSTRWGMVYEDDTDKPTPSRRGRGKMVPLRGDPSTVSKKRKAYFPSDPADARAALLSKRSVRALSYRQQNHRSKGRRRTAKEIVCICRGTDDGRRLVQCDECDQWYHLECIGIQDVSELGREEDPWYCHSCIPDTSSTESVFDEEIREPTFVPTDETPSKFKRFDLAVDPDSPAPNWPKTPTREPVTPRNTVRVYSTPGFHDGFRGGPDYDDFDPTSTPSRGITFNAPYMTPKSNNLFHPRGGLATTPSRRGSKASGGFGGQGFLNAMLDSPPSSSSDSLFRTPRRVLDPSRPGFPRFEIPDSPRPSTDLV